MPNLSVIYRAAALVQLPPKFVLVPATINATDCPTSALLELPASVELTPESPQWAEAYDRAVIEPRLDPTAEASLNAVKVLVTFEQQDDGKFAPASLELVEAA